MRLILLFTTSLQGILQGYYNLYPICTSSLKPFTSKGFNLLYRKVTDTKQPNKINDLFSLVIK